MERHIITREQLYQLVWAEPMRSLARRFGISDVGLAKNCKKMDIPLPPRGYWAKKAAGKSVHRTPLAKLPPNCATTPQTLDISVDLSGLDLPPATDTSAADPVAAQAEYESLPVNRITVPAQLRSPHRLTQTTVESLRAEAHRLPDDWRYKAGPRFEMEVSKPLFHRALRILDMLVKSFDRRGWQGHISVSEDRKTPFVSYVSILGQPLRFGIEEPVRRVKNEPGQPLGTPKFRDEPSGRLCLVIRGLWVEGERHRLCDTDGQLIEDRLNEFILSLVTIAKEDAECLQRQREEWQRQLEADQLQREEQRRKELELARLQALQEQASRWALSQTVSAYLAAVRAEAERQSGGVQASSPLGEWLDWAEQQAAMLNPLAFDLAALPDLLLLKRTL